MAAATTKLPQLTEIPAESKEARRILKLVKKTTETEHSVDKGLEAWEASLKQAVAESKTPEQAVVDHWLALEYLHKTNAKAHVAQEQPEDNAATATIKAIAASTRLFFQIPVLKHTQAAAATARHAASPARGKRDATPSDERKPKVKAASPGVSSSPKEASPLAEMTASSIRSVTPTRFRGKASVVPLSDLTFAAGDPYSKIVEKDGKPVTHLKPNAKFRNFGKNINNKPLVTFEPQTKVGVCNIVKWAVANGRKVRAAGYRHTWSSIYSETGEVLVSMIPADRAEHKSINTHPPPIPTGDELESIQWLGEEAGIGYVKVGASTSNDQFRVWALQNGWTIPMSVDLVEITFGGSTTPMTHGTGLKHPTMADLIVAVEFVNANGELQTVVSDHQLRAAAGSLGLMGIVTAVTIKVDKMTHAAMKPYKTPAMLGVPPPPDWDDSMIPAQLNIRPSAPQLKGAQKTFEAQIEEDYYNEYFWFPFQENVFINCWQNNGDPAKSKPMSNCEALMQDVQGALGSYANAFLGLFQGSGEFMTKFVAWSAMKVLPDMSSAKEPEVTPIIEAFYFRRGLHNMPMRDMEMIIPIPGRKDKPDKPDWTIINRAWWDCIAMIYKEAENDRYPVRLGLAMHIISDSNMLMAPERGNKGKHTFGSLTINISTVPETPNDLWIDFCQRLAVKWQSYTYADGTRLNVRTHWVKEWDHLTGPDGVTPLAEYYHKVAYHDQIKEFRAQLKKIAQAGKFDYKLMKRTFSNPLLQSVIWPDTK